MEKRKSASDNIHMFFECETKITNRIKYKIFDSEEAEDLRQEVFIHFVQGLKNIKNTENLCGYLLRITDNLVNDYYRKKHKVSSGNFPLLETVGGVEEEVMKDHFFSELSLLAFINKLPEKYKEALILTELNGESQKKVAEKLNISYSGLKSRVQRAREMLKKEILNCCDYKFDVYGNIVSCCENNPCG